MTVTTTPLDDARELEAGAFAAARWRRSKTDYEIGGRGSWQQQANTGFADESRSAINGFGGVMRRIGERVQLRASVSSGLRFPSLSERFFTGTCRSRNAWLKPSKLWG